ncbi:hypothetical protein [Streptomyces sp. SAS_270]|uniref:hypothetical protein n=1 Tax=Streptomyces sp. SAS_270 TaxID=3412748 RepID=UPI00403C78F7
MDAEDLPEPRQWSTTSPEELDRLACGVLSAARDAARELRREPADAARRAWALGMLAGQTQAMLGPDLPDHPPVGIAAQEGFVHTALALAVHIRARSWSERDLGAASVPGQDAVPHPGEAGAADAFDVLGRLMLPHTSPEGWSATLVTDLARGNQRLEAAVKLGKYVLHPTFVALTDDVTRLIGEALHNLNVDRLQGLTRSLRHYASAAGPSHPADPVPAPAVDIPAPMPDRPSVMGPESSEGPDSQPRFRRPRGPSSHRRMASEPVPPDAATPASAEPPRHPGSSEPRSPGAPRPRRPETNGPIFTPRGPTADFTEPQADEPIFTSIWGQLAPLQTWDEVPPPSSEEWRVGSGGFTLSDPHGPWPAPDISHTDLPDIDDTEPGGLDPF